MTNKNNRIIQKIRRVMFRRGRPKGKRFFPITITLTQEQIDYLQKQPNASKLIREILDDLIKARENIERDLPIISLQKQMVELKKQGDKLWHERNEHLSENPLNDYVQRPKNTNTTEELLRSMTLKPSAPDDVKVAFKVIREYTNAIKKLDDEVAAIKKRIIKSE